MSSIWRYLLGTALTAGILLYPMARAAADSSLFSVFTGSALEHHLDPSYSNRWAVGFDNDFLVPGSRDQDYTYGLSILHTGVDLDGELYFAPLNLIEGMLGLDPGSRQAVEFGLYGFTPEDIEQSEADPNDRPYASLVYAATRSERIYPLRGTVISSQLTVGILGLDMVGDLQKGMHSVIDGDTPQGWRHQISDGGEPTFRYSLARQQLLGDPTDRLEVKHTQSVSVGYITEASWGLSLRTGQLNSPWHNFHPEQASYAETSTQLTNRSVERFFWAGIAVKARLYNTFLQGQWRDSAVEYSSSDLRHLIIEAWVGYTHGFPNGVFVSYGLRGHTSEIRHGKADRNVVWGGIMVGRNLE
jgi:hypothetical protein